MKMSLVTKRIQGAVSLGSGKTRESAMSGVVACHHCKKTGHKVRYCKILARKLRIEKREKFDHGRRKWFSYHKSNGHSNEKYYQQKLEMGKPGKSILAEKAMYLP